MAKKDARLIVITFFYLRRKPSFGGKKRTKCLKDETLLKITLTANCVERFKPF